MDKQRIQGEEPLENHQHSLISGHAVEADKQTWRARHKLDHLILYCIFCCCCEFILNKAESDAFIQPTSGLWQLTFFF